MSWIKAKGWTPSLSAPFVGWILYHTDRKAIPSSTHTPPSNLILTGSVVPMVLSALKFISPWVISLKTCWLKKTPKAPSHPSAKVKRFSLRITPLMNVRFFHWKLFPIPAETTWMLVDATWNVVFDKEGQNQEETVHFLCLSVFLLSQDCQEDFSNKAWGDRGKLILSLWLLFPHKQTLSFATSLS